MRIETTKILLLASWAAAVIFSVLTVIFSLRGVSVDGLQLVVSLTWAEVTALNGFYVWKAKNENRAKDAQRFITEIADRYGIEAAASVAETILKD